MSIACSSTIVCQAYMPVCQLERVRTQRAILSLSFYFCIWKINNFALPDLIFIETLSTLKCHLKSINFMHRNVKHEFTNKQTNKQKLQKRTVPVHISLQIRSLRALLVCFLFCFFFFGYCFYFSFFVMF